MVLHKMVTKVLLIYAVSYNENNLDAHGMKLRFHFYHEVFAAPSQAGVRLDLIFVSFFLLSWKKKDWNFMEHYFLFNLLITKTLFKDFGAFEKSTKRSKGIEI